MKNHFVVEDGILTQYDGTAAHVVIPNGVKAIADEVFVCHTEIHSVTIPKSVRSIGAHAFRDCFGLTAVKGMEGVRELGSYAFGLCESLTHITLPNTLKTIADNAFVRVPFKKIVIPDSVRSVGERAFSQCVKATELVWPGTVKRIPKDCFAGCDGLTELTLPDNVTEIGACAFMSCKGLSKLTLPDTLRIIREEAFGHCTRLTSVTVPGSVKTLPRNAFSECTALKTVWLEEGVTTLGDGAFALCKNLLDLHCPTTLKRLGHNVLFSCQHVTVHATKKSSMERYAKKNKLAFLPLADVTEHACRTYFCITGDFRTRNVTERLGITPYKRMDSHLFSGRTTDWSELHYGYNDVYDVDLNRMLRVTLKELLPLKAELVALKAEFNLTYSLVAVPEIASTSDEPKPILSLASDIVAFLYETGTEIDLDYYVY